MYWPPSISELQEKWKAFQVWPVSIHSQQSLWQMGKQTQWIHLWTPETQPLNSDWLCMVINLLKYNNNISINKWWNRELTLKCKLKCYLNPWITHWALALVKGIREPHEVKKKSFDLGGNRTHDLRIRSTVSLPTELRGRTEKVGDDKVVNRGEEKVRVHMNVVPRSTKNTNGETEN